MKIVKCDKCGVELDGREKCMVQRNTPDGHPIDLCDTCFKEYDKVWDEASREFNQKNSELVRHMEVNKWKHGGK